MPSVVLAAYNEIVYRILKGLKMFNLIELYEKFNTPKPVKIFKCFLCGNAETLSESSYTSIGIWYLIF